ncbi:peptidase M75 superfamily protein [Fulvivirga sp. RKSG066]|uniref:imelysin family protein n=1 Tax=Fulvivirga aurantia TaxID=2529383 RepID=UPI0012BD7202|nr:imelysin family protein [Fulvivirga aurantia]MTI21061.1 peptidase M75 superfamily protein [Fulvivirga aurantia]
MKKVLSVFLVVLVFWACSEDGEPTIEETPSDNFDRKAMLVNWADNIIVPGYTAYAESTTNLVEAKDAFITLSNEDNLADLRSAWKDAYIAWQKVSMFEIGKAEQITLRAYTNIFPTDASEIESKITQEDFDLSLPSSRDAQGFPALDYLLYGAAETDAALVARFNEEQALKDYLSTVTDKLNSLAKTVLNDWENGYRTTFVEKSGSDASSSVNKLLNDYMYYYEKALRAGKVGIPAGVFSDGGTLSDRVEAYYNREISKELLMTGLQASIDFFNGVHFDGTTAGESLHSYLDFVQTISEGENLSALINNQFNSASDKGNTLNNNLYEEVETNNTAMLQTYDELQKNVVLMKVDMFQALNVKVDFVDADGD